MNVDKKWLLFLKTATIVKKELGIDLPSDSVVYYYDDLLFIDTLVFIRPSTVINVCHVTDVNRQRYEVLNKIFKEEKQSIDNGNIVVLTKDYYIEKYEVNRQDTIKLFERKFSLEELEQIIKSVSESNNLIDKYHYNNDQYQEYIEYSYGVSIAEKILPKMLNRKIIVCHGNAFCGAFVLGKINNLQHIQQYPEEQFLMLIYFFQYLRHIDNPNFTIELVNIFKKYHFKLDLLPIFVNNFEFTANDMLTDTTKLLWLTDEERSCIIKDTHKLLSIDHKENFKGII